MNSSWKRGQTKSLVPSTSGYKVIPEKPVVPTREEVQDWVKDKYIKKDVDGCLGFVLASIALGVSNGIIGTLVLIYWEPRGVLDEAKAVVWFVGWLLLAFLIACLLDLVASSIRSRRERREIDREIRREIDRLYQERIQRSINEANKLTMRASSLLEESLRLTAELPEYLKSATDWLTRASYEYKEHAYGPFWEAIMNAARCLGSFWQNLEKISSNAQEYPSLLNGRKHTFPEFPIRPASLPNPTPVIKEFYQLVRKGQTNFEFASIWEHYKTREVLIVGFTTLGEAIQHLGTQIESMMSRIEKIPKEDGIKRGKDFIRYATEENYRKGYDR